MVEHTPGPWTCEPTPSSDFVTRRIFGPSSEKIADVGVPGRSNLPIHVEVANASLIAAAPELLEALETYANGYLLDEFHNPTICYDDAHRDAVSKVFAAIAKARGQ